MILNLQAREEIKDKMKLQYSPRKTYHMHLIFNPNNPVFLCLTAFNIDYLTSPLAMKHTSYVKDSYDFVKDSYDFVKNNELKQIRPALVGSPVWGGDWLV